MRLIETGLHRIGRLCWAMEGGMRPHVEKLSLGSAAPPESDPIRRIIRIIPSLLLTTLIKKIGKPIHNTPNQAIWDPMICHLQNHQGHSNIRKRY